MTTSFYVPPERLREGRFALSEDEARHAGRVLRMQPGAEIFLVDGDGGWYRGILDHVDKRAVTGKIVESRRDVGEPPFRLTIAMALVKNRSRFETFLEKAVELGVSRVVPVISERTEKESLRERRAENILIAAMKQCGRSRMTRLGDPVAFSEFVRAEQFDVALCCHESAAPDRGIMSVLRSMPQGGSTSVLIGPEGGFTAQEIEEASEAGYHIVSLGPRRLRAETAAIAAAAVVSLWYEDGTEE